MKNPISMTEFEAFKGHEEPAFDIACLEDDWFIPNKSFEIGFEEFENEIKICFIRKDIE